MFRTTPTLSLRGVTHEENRFLSESDFEAEANPPVVSTAPQSLESPDLANRAAGWQESTPRLLCFSMRG